MCIISTLFCQANLQFNEVLHQRKLALHKKFALLQSNDCDGLLPGQNGGLQFKMHAVYINIYTQGMGCRTLLLLIR